MFYATKSTCCAINYSNFGYNYNNFTSNSTTNSLDLQLGGTPPSVILVNNYYPFGMQINGISCDCTLIQ